MIDPLLAPLQRLEASRPGAAPRRTKPAHTSKIITAGASATALLTMVAAMGWQSGTSSANSGADPTITDPAAASVVAPLVTTPVAPSSAPTLPPLTVPPVSVVAVPATPAPTAPPAPPTAAPVVTLAPVVIPVAVPAPPAVTKTVKHKSTHTVTKSSG